jgi:hypothetical protein
MQHLIWNNRSWISELIKFFYFWDNIKVEKIALINTGNKTIHFKLEKYKMFLENTVNHKEQFGWIEVICGSMFSGKTEEFAD